jgi:Phosphorylase superfamily
VAVLVCAATRSELGACARGVGASGVASTAFEMLRTGVGPAHAARALGDRLARDPRPGLVVSSGLAGALDAGIPVGTWVTATRVAEWRAGALAEVDVLLREPLDGALRCHVVSSGHLYEAGDRRGLAGLGSPAAVDMESAALAREASKRGIPFMILRLVSDTPDHPLPAFLSPFAAAMAATDTRSTLAHAARGVGSALVDPRGIARLLRDGAAWTRDIAQGWERFARLLS